MHRLNCVALPPCPFPHTQLSTTQSLIQAERTAIFPLPADPDSVSENGYTSQFPFELLFRPTESIKHTVQQHHSLYLSFSPGERAAVTCQGLAMTDIPVYFLLFFGQREREKITLYLSVTYLCLTLIAVAQGNTQYFFLEREEKYVLCTD